MKSILSISFEIERFLILKNEGKTSKKMPENCKLNHLNINILTHHK
jgi:hypothetical protein